MNSLAQFNTPTTAFISQLSAQGLFEGLGLIGGRQQTRGLDLLGGGQPTAQGEQHDEE